MDKLLRAAPVLLVLCFGCPRDSLKSLPSTASAPSLLAFGDVQVGNQKSLALAVTNESLLALALVGIQVSPPFSVTAGPVTIPPSGTVTVDVVFAPQAGQPFDQSMTLQLSATETPTLTVQVTGNGLVPPPACSAANCGAGHACCGDQCVDTQSDATHCGGCSACASGQTCVSGACVTPPACTAANCGTGHACCGDQCVDTQSDATHCGGCSACPSGQPCVSGACVAPPPPGCSAATCGTGHACCGDQCVDTQGDPAHCGGCTACATGQTCNSGTCTTPTPTSCDNLTAPCPGTQKCCSHACTDVGPAGVCPCTGPGGATTFDAGTIIIPMDACYQRGADVTTLPTYCTGNAKTTADDSPLKAYGLVFFLLRHQVTVYMAINPNKTSIDAVDLSLGSFVTRTAPVQRYDWPSAKVVSLTDVNVSSVSYRGGPFIIDASQHDRVLALFASDPDFAQFRSAANITVHVADKSFQTAVAKSISAVPSRVALLVPAADARPAAILVRYLASAGLDFPGAGGTPASHGQIYDQLQESDFLPDYDHSNLKAGGYKLLWSPHWEGGTSNTPAQLATIGAYVSAGNDLFAECAAIGTLEGFNARFNGGGGYTPGSSATRFLTSNGTKGNGIPSGSGPYGGPFTYGGLSSAFAQRGDFPFAGFGGAITDFHPDSGAGSTYYSDVVRYISATDSSGNPTDLFASVDLHASGKGTVVYLAGHDYSYGGNNSGAAGVTAGSRLVLNTLFSLGTNDICTP